MIYLFVGIGGVIGSLLRYLLSILLVGFWGKEFPFETLLINLSGAFLLGWFSSTYVTPKKLHPYFLTAFSTGIIGSYTTFSTFCLETVQLMDAGNYVQGLMYIVISLFGGLLFVQMGIHLGEHLIKKAG